MLLWHLPCIRPLTLAQKHDSDIIKTTRNTTILLEYKFAMQNEQLKTILLVCFVFKKMFAEPSMTNSKWNKFKRIASVSKQNKTKILHLNVHLLKRMFFLPISVSFRVSHTYTNTNAQTFAGFVLQEQLKTKKKKRKKK